MAQDYYRVLGIGRNADSRTIQKAFHKLAKQLHPDRNPHDLQAEERFKLVSQAYETLSNPVKKSQYDLKLKYGYTPPVQPTRKRPYYPRARMYRRPPRTFSRRAQILGGFSIVMIIILVLFISFFLLRYNSRYNFQRGLSNYQNQRYSAAYFNFKQSLGPFNPYQAAAHLLMADICFHRQRDLLLTTNHITEGLDAHPSDSIKGRLYFLQGKMDFAQGNYQPAYRNFERSLQLLPQLDSALYRLGDIDAFILGRYQIALQHYQELVARNPKYFDAYMGMAFCYGQLGQPDAVIESVDKGLTIRQDVGTAFYLKALAAQSLDHRQLACANFEAANNLGLSVAADSLRSYCQGYQSILTEEDPDP